MPLVDLQVSTAGQQLTAAGTPPPQQKTRPISFVLPDDSTIPPEAAVLSDQPNLLLHSTVVGQAEMEMFRKNAKEGMANTSESHPVTTAAAKKDKRRDKKEETQKKRKEKLSSSSSSSVSLSYSGASSSNYSSSASRSGSTTTTKRTDSKADISAQMEAAAERKRKHHKGTKEAGEEEPKKGGKWQSIKQFFTKSFMVIIALVIILALTGLGIYLLFKSGKESNKLTQQIAQDAKLQQEETALQAQNETLRELQKQNIALQTVQAEYEAQLEKFHRQNEFQMQAIEKINAERVQYEQQLAEWQRYYASVQQQQQQGEAGVEGEGEEVEEGAEVDRIERGGAEAEQKNAERVQFGRLAQMEIFTLHDILQQAAAEAEEESRRAEQEARVVEIVEDEEELKAEPKVEEAEAEPKAEETTEHYADVL